MNEEGSGTQCEGCYESYSSRSVLTMPRKLKCGHYLCQKCIETELTENVFYCPFCFHELQGTIDEISELCLYEMKENEIEENIENEEVRGVTVTPRTSSLSLFTQENPRGFNPSPSLPSSSSSSINSTQSEEKTSRTSDPFKFGECKEENCQKKACASHGYCLNHSSKKKYSVMTESKIANALANTPLDFMSVEGNSLQLRESTHIWPEVEPDELIARFRDQKRMSMGEAIDLINRAKIIFSREPNVLYLEAPAVVIGDIHGQFYDLLNILEVGGKPGRTDHYLFLGDYVDRGSFSCEVILTLLAFKVIYPERVWLIRGNHECASVSGHFGFKEECKMKYGVQVYYSFLLLFQSLPLAAVISTSYGQLFACHGGLSPTVDTLDDLSKIDRFVEPEENSSLLDILWSDPVNEEAVDDMTTEEYEEFISIEWKPNPSRGCSYFYGYQAVHKFLERNNLLCIIRAHEVQELGFQKHFDPALISERLHVTSKFKYNRRITSAVISQDHQFRPNSLAHLKSPIVEPSSTRRPFADISENEDWESSPNFSPSEPFECEIDMPSVITVFSAPNYCDRYANKGAILKIEMELQGFRVLQYDCVEHPKPEITESQMNNHILTVIAICPYMPTSFRDFVRLAIEIGPEDNLIEDDEVYEVAIPTPSLSLDTQNSTVSPLSSPVKSKIDQNFEVSTGQSTTADVLSTPVSDEKRSKFVLWHAIDEETIDSIGSDTPSQKELPTSGSMQSGDKENIFSPQEVRKRSSSMKKAGGSTEISVITRTGGHGFSLSAEDIPSSSRSPEFSFGGRNRSQSERGFPSKQLRRLSSGARLEGAAKAALELSRLDVFIESPLKNGSPILPDGKKSRRSSTAGTYVSRYKTHVMRSTTYTQALASDAINELHPDRLAKFMKNIQPAFKLSDQEKPITPVSTLKLRFEKKKIEATAVKDEESQTRHSYVNCARQELLEYSQSIERGRTASVSSLREKFDRKAKENTQRFLAETKRNKFRKRSASLEPTPSPDDIQRKDSKELRFEDELPEIRGRRSRRLSVESYFHVDSSGPRAHSLSPAPPPASGPASGDHISHPSEHSSKTITANNSPPRQRAMAIICQPNPIDEGALSSNLRHPSTRNRSDAIESNNHRPKSTPSASISAMPSTRQSPDSYSATSSSPSPRVGVEYEFLLKYKPDNENKVHFTKRELLALRLLFSLFDRSGCAMIGYEDLVAYGEETGGLSGIRDAALAIEIVDIDGDGKIGLLDFIHFAARLQLLFQRNLMKRVFDELMMNAAASNPI